MSKTIKSLAWYNFTTQDYDYFENLPDDENKVLDYLPHGSARNLYKLYRADHHTVLEAMVKVMELVCGKEKP